MSIEHTHNAVCGPDCRYRSLYEGSQTSLADMAHRQAQALARVGRLRSGMILSLRRNFGRAFAEAELALGHRLTEVDDEILLAYLGHIMSASPAAGPSVPEGLEELRKALTDSGVQVPSGNDLSSWADVVRAQRSSRDAINSELTELFASDIPEAFRVPLGPPPSEEAPPRPRDNAPASAPSKPARKTLSSLREENQVLQESAQTAKDELAEMFAEFEPGDLPPEPELKTPPDTFPSFDDIPLSEPPEELDFDLPPSDPYSSIDKPAQELPLPAASQEASLEELPFPQAAAEDSSPAEDLSELPFPMAAAPAREDKESEPTSQEPSGGKEGNSRGQKPRETSRSQKGTHEGSDDLSALFGEGKPVSRSARRRKARKAAQEKVEEELPTPVLAEKPQLTTVPWGSKSPAGEINLKDLGDQKEVNLPDMHTPEVSLPDEDLPFPSSAKEAKPTLASLEVENRHPAQSTAPTAVAEVQAPPAPQPVQEPPRVHIPALRPEILPLMKVPPRARKQPASRTARTQATPPDGRLFDIPAEMSNAPAAELSDQTRQALLAAVCIPRPVFTSDLVSVAGSQELVDAWETECRSNSQSPVRFVAAKTRHRLRGSLVIPVNYLRDAATEFKRSAWAECMERYRGTTLYELAVLLHKIEPEIVATRANDNALTLRLATRSGLVGIVVALTAKLAPGEITRATVAAELEMLLGERLTLIAVLTPRAETFDPMCTAVIEESKARQWSVPLPVVASKSWEYAEDRGSASQLLMGA